MITVEEALQLIHMQVRDFGVHEIDLLRSAGRILAQNVIADRNYPPFDRVTMDGIAIDSRAFQSGRRSFNIAGIQAAGQPQQTLTKAANCIEVMTGAMLPAGCDAVIQYELCCIEDRIANVNTDAVNPYQNIHKEGTDSKQGEILLNADQVITPAMIGLMAAAGLSRVYVKRLPAVAVCATGDELVEVEQTPLAHQIRQSNSYMLVAALQAEGITAHRCHLHDHAAEMLAQLNKLITSHDIVLLSGAVSKGKFDYLPEVLKQLGMQTIFHGIAQRPGKPFLLGVMPNEALIFGFPGNPVSTFVCYHLYFKEWLYTCIGKKQTVAKAFQSRPFSFKPDLAYHMLVKLTYDSAKIIATPIDNVTSGDLVSLARTEGILSLPADKQAFATDETFDLLIL